MVCSCCCCSESGLLDQESCDRFGYGTIRKHIDVLSEAGWSIHLLMFWWKQSYKFVLTILLHVSQHAWRLKATWGKTYSWMDTSSTRSRNYTSNPSKHQFEYAYLLEEIIFSILYDSIKRNIYVNSSYVSFYMSNNYVELWVTVMESSDPVSNKDAQYLFIPGNKIKINNNHIIQCWKSSPQPQVFEYKRQIKDSKKIYEQVQKKW